MRRDDGARGGKEREDLALGERAVVAVDRHVKARADARGDSASWFGRAWPAAPGGFAAVGAAARSATREEVVDRRTFAGRLRRSVGEPRRAAVDRARPAGQPQELDDLRSVAERIAVAVDGPLPPGARGARVPGARRGGADVRVMRHRAARDEPAAEILDKEW